MQGYILCKILRSGEGPLWKKSKKFRYMGKKWKGRMKKWGKLHKKRGKGLKNASFWDINSNFFRGGLPNTIHKCWICTFKLFMACKLANKKDKWLEYQARTFLFSFCSEQWSFCAINLRSFNSGTNWLLCVQEVITF